MIALIHSFQATNAAMKIHPPPMMRVSPTVKGSSANHWCCLMVHRNICRGYTINPRPSAVVPNMKTNTLKVSDDTRDTSEIVASGEDCLNNTTPGLGGPQLGYLPLFLDFS